MSISTAAECDVMYRNRNFVDTIFKSIFAQNSILTLMSLDDRRGGRSICYLPLRFSKFCHNMDGSNNKVSSFQSLVILTLLLLP